MPFTADEAQLSEFFSFYGPVASVKILQRDGRSIGKGFVQFQNPADAAKARKGTGIDFNGRQLEIRFASEPPPARTEGRPAGRSGAATTSGKTVFVGGLSYNSTQESVAEFFKGCGNLQQVRVALDQEGNPRGFAHVEFDTDEAVQAALALSGQALDGRSIRIDVAGAKGEKPAGGFASRGGPQRRGGFSGGRSGGFGGRSGGFGGRGGAPRGGISKNKGSIVPGAQGKKTKLGDE